MRNKNNRSIDCMAFQSRLGSCNASFKIIFSFLSLILCVLSRSPYVPLFNTLSMAAISIYGGVRPTEYLRLMLVPAWFIAAGTIAIAIGISSEPVSYSVRMFSVYLYVSEHGVKTALSAAARALGAVSSLYMLSLSTPLAEIAEAMRKIHIPHIIISLMYLIYRSVFILSDVCRSIKTSAVSRLGLRDFKTSCTSFASSAASLFVISMKKANSYYDAMVSRGYDGELLFSVEDKPMKKHHIIIGTAYIAAMLAAVIIFR